MSLIGIFREWEKKSCIETSIGISQLHTIWDTAYCEYLSNRINVTPFLLDSFKDIVCKVQLFWEGHKNVRNRPYGFDVY